jgi:5-methylcytosine-specific restriction endonuclease McrA
MKKIIHIKTTLRFVILCRDQFRCVYCGRTSQEATLEVDHIIPRSKGGSNLPTNLVTACYECNMGKSDNELNHELWSMLFHRIYKNASMAYLSNPIRQTKHG